jgi:hypothetical protein
MEFPIEVKVSIKKSKLKHREVGPDVAQEVAYNELFDKIRRLNIVQVDDNAFESTARVSIKISV